jgi:hypothetical protein
MNFQGIEKILGKYFQGETSLQEEQKLREFFRQEKIPAHLLELKDQFAAFDEESNIKLPDDFDDVLFEKINAKERQAKASKRMYIYYISGVAASLIILITLFIRFDPFVAPTNNDMTSPEMAFEEASRILYFVSEKFNQGAQPLGKVARFDEGMTNLNSVSKFDEGVNKTAPVSRFSQITKLITNPAP